jgi:hypothetical protein
MPADGRPPAAADEREGVSIGASAADAVVGASDGRLVPVSSGGGGMAPTGVAVGYPAFDAVGVTVATVAGVAGGVIAIRPLSYCCLR